MTQFRQSSDYKQERGAQEALREQYTECDNPTGFAHGIKGTATLSL